MIGLTVKTAQLIVYHFLIRVADRITRLPRRVKRIQAKCQWHFVPLSGFARDGEPRPQAEQGLRSALGTVSVR